MTCCYRLCYTEATIFEIQRLGSIAPQAVPHRTLGDVTGGSNETGKGFLLFIAIKLAVRGYKIPKDTFVFSMLYYIMR